MAAFIGGFLGFIAGLLFFAIVIDSTPSPQGPSPLSLAIAGLGAIVGAILGVIGLHKLNAIAKRRQQENP